MKRRLDHLTSRRTAAWGGRALLLSLLLLACTLGAALAPTPAHAQSADLPFAPDVNGTVNAIARQADGKIVIVGEFTMVNGEPRQHIARLLPSGDLDEFFSPNISRGGQVAEVYSLDVQADGKILVGGAFAFVNGIPRNFLARLHSDGSVDTSFAPNFDYIVTSTKIQRNQDILVGGMFGIVNGETHNRIVRLHPDGSVDSTFTISFGTEVLAIVIDDSDNLYFGGYGFVRRYNLSGVRDNAFLPTINERVETILLQPDGKTVIGGRFWIVNGQSRLYIARLNRDGTIDTEFNASANGHLYTLSQSSSGGTLVGGGFTEFSSVKRSRIADVDPINGQVLPGFSFNISGTVKCSLALPDQSILIGGSFTQIDGQPRNRLARLSPNGRLDVVLGITANNNVYAFSNRLDEAIEIGGAFTTLDGQSHAALARLTPTVTVDSAFTPTVAGAVYSLLTTPDDHLLVGGAFSAMNGAPRTNLARLLPDAALDEAFAPNPDGPVYGLLRQADGSVLAAGSFMQIGGGNVPRLARLDAAGALDPTFVPSPSAAVRALAQQRDGKLVIGGDFTSVGGQPAVRLARLTEAGAFDASFSASAAGGDVYAMLVQPDGKIVVGGAFTQINGQARPYLARLEANGTLDAAFAPTTTLGGAVYALALQPDGRLIVGGAFTSVSVDGTPVTRNRLARFEADGALDMIWDANANDTVYAIALQPDGKVLVGGAFTTMGGQPHGHIARLSSDLAAFQTLAVASDGDSVLWTQAGAGPELTAVRFYSSTDAVNYTAMGEGVRLDTGWTITDVALPLTQNVWVRAYGEYPGGQSNGSTSAYDSVRVAYVRAADVVMTTQVVGGASVPGDWVFTAAGKQAAGNGTLRTDAGSYTVSYRGPADYTLTGVSGACSLANDVITLNAALGANTCTFTFTRDTGSITFAKTVEGGTALASAFSFTVGAQTASHNQALVIETGVYTVTENGPAGYQVRTTSGACALVNGAIRLTVTKAGGTCTVYNAWPITLAKQVSGGTAVASEWQFTVAGQTLAPGSQVVLAPGSYPVTESGPADYTLYSASGDCAIDQGVVQITVPGATGLCTITNRRDTGPIAFVKTVEGGAATPAAFSFTVLTQTVPHGQAATFETGVYTITENGPAGYTLRHAAGVCTLVNGALRLTVTKTGGSCLVYNTWPVTFAKVVEGGDALPAAWSFGVNGQTVAPGASLLLPPGTYPVTESGPARYSLAAASGDCALVDGAAVLTVPAAASSTGVCTLTNRRDTGVITFQTTVEGDGAVAGNFNYGAGGQEANGDNGQLTLPTAVYTVTVTGPTGFTPRIASGVCTLVGGVVQMTVEKPGGVCAVTMTHPVKFVSVVEGGTRNPAAYSLRIGDQVIFHNRSLLLAAGVYTPTLQGSVSTYTLVDARDACDLDALGQTIIMTAPGNGLCTVVHRRNTGAVTFTRIVQGGDAQPSDWVTLVDGQPMPLDTPVVLDTATYIVTESGPPDYVVTAASGICALDKGQIKLTVTDEGGECGLVSTRGIGPVGFVMYPGGGTAQASEWSFVVNGQVVPHNGALLMPVGLYTVTVQGPAGYTVIGASGICSLTESNDVQMTVGVEGGACNLQSAYDGGGVGAIGFYAAPSDDAPPAAWGFVANGQEVEHSQTLLMPVGSYAIAVNGPAGYHVTGATGVCALVDGAVRLTVTVFGGACTVQTAPDAAPPPQSDFAVYLPAVTR